MSETPDGANEMLRAQTQAALAVAGRLGEVLARQRAEQNAQRLRAVNDERRKLEERFEAERAVMRTELAAVQHPLFWERAAADEVAARYAQARQWEPFDDLARSTREHLEAEIRRRYRLNPADYFSAAVPAGAGDAAARARRTAERDFTAAGQQWAAVAAGDLQNDTDTRNAAAAAEELWDSGERRMQLADSLAQRFGHSPEGRDGAAAVLAADRDNGTPPETAVKGSGKKRRTRARRSGVQPGRSTELGLG